MELRLVRTYHEGGTNGSVFLEEVFVCHSIELPWLNNEHQRSCIPEGRYKLKKRWSNKFGDHYLLVNVPGRECILIHPANDALKELKGCIAPVIHLTGEGRGSFSRMALKLVHHHVDEVIESEKVFLTITTNIHENPNPVNSSYGELSLTGPWQKDVIKSIRWWD